jgi:putative transcriptional regulator
MENRLKALRAECGWSQAELAERLDVSRQTVNAIETGKYDPSLPLAFKIARLFGQPIEAIFRDAPISTSILGKQPL